MATLYLVDTHALIWFLEGNARLGTTAKAVLENPTSLLIIPIIVIAEACWIIEHHASLCCLVAATNHIATGRTDRLRTQPRMRDTGSAVRDWLHNFFL